MVEKEISDDLLPLVKRYTKNDGDQSSRTKVKRSYILSRILVIPDCQVKPGTSIAHLANVGMYAAEKKPDTIVCLGDFADMPSLSSYDRGKKSFEGRMYVEDIKAAREAMTAFLEPIREEQARLKRNKEKQWNPRLVLTLGNHEARITRAVEEDRKLEGLVKIEDLGYADFGWEVYPFLEPVCIDGVVFCHYFVSGVAGRPVSTAVSLLNKKHQSCLAGHQQGKQIAYGTRADGSNITAMIVGSFYEHDEEYMGAQGNKHWRGVVVLHEVSNGSFDEMLVSLDYLHRKYG